MKIKTVDKVEIAFNYYKSGFDEVVIVMPGWCMTKDSNAFVQIAEMFASDFDVISMDFRGHGKSKGFYTFTAKELNDIDAIIGFAKNQNYKKIFFAGFSLGGALAVLYAGGAASKRSKNNFKNDITKVIAVSAPCDFDKIENEMWKKEAWGETFKKFELGRFLSVRPSAILHHKPKPIDFVDKITVPTLFIAGEKDPTVHFWHTQTLYEKALCPKKYKFYEGGIHAEDLYLEFKDDFSKLTKDFLKEEIL